MHKKKLGTDISNKLKILEKLHSLEYREKTSFLPIFTRTLNDFNARK